MHLWSEIAVWEAEQNKTNIKVNWQFTNQNARTQLHRLYPAIEEMEN